MASQPGRERDYADATSRRAAEIQTAMVSIRRLGHETEFFRRSLRRYSDMGPSFPLFSPNPEAPHTALAHLHGSLRIARG